MKDEFDDKRLGSVGSGQLTEAKVLKRTVRWHEQQMCFSWAGGTRCVTELVVLSGRTDTRTVTNTRTPSTKATDGGARDAWEPLEAFRTAIVLDRPDGRCTAKAARNATTELEKLDWVRMTQLANSLMAHDELEWIFHTLDVPEKCMGCGDPEGSGSEAVEQLGQHLIEVSCTFQRVIALPSVKTVRCITSRAAAGGLNPVQLLAEAGTERKLEWLWTRDIRAAHKGEGKSKEKHPATNHDAEAVGYHSHRKGHRRRDREALERGKGRRGENAADEASGLTAGAAGAPSSVPSRVNMIELLAVSIDEHEEVVGSVERTEVGSGAAVSVCPFRCAAEIPMPNHSRRAMLRTASGAQIQRADQKTTWCENGGDTLVSINFKASDATILLVAVGELEKRGMTVVMGPLGLETRSQATKLAGRNLSSKHSNGAYWVSLTRWEDGAKTVAPVDLGDVASTLNSLNEPPSVSDAIDVAREDAEANVLSPVTTPEESGGVKRPRNERTHVAHMDRCSSCVAGRGTDDSHRKSDTHNGSPRVECE